MISPYLSDEEPEEELTLQQLMERAELGDARAQTRVSKSHTDSLALGIVVSSCSLTQSGGRGGCVFLFLAGWKMIPYFQYDTSILTHTNHSKHRCNVTHH